MIIDCHGDEEELLVTLSPLVSGAVDGVVSEVLVLGGAAKPGVATLAEAAGCRHFPTWTATEVLQAAKSPWLLFLESGARPQAGWIKEMADYCSLWRKPARLRAARNFRLPLWQRIAHRPADFERGLLIRREEARAVNGSAQDLTLLARLKAREIAAEIIPASVWRHERRQEEVRR